MAQYISQMRRGIKDDSIGRNDWAEYEQQPGHIKPLEGELVLEYDNGVPRLKIGNGQDEFSVLPYMSVDSFILPTSASITIYPDKWEQTKDEEGNFVVSRDKSKNKKSDDPKLQQETEQLELQELQGNMAFLDIDSVVYYQNLLKEKTGVFGKLGSSFCQIH